MLTGRKASKRSEYAGQSPSPWLGACSRWTVEPVPCARQKRVIYGKTKGREMEEKKLNAKQRQLKEKRSRVRSGEKVGGKFFVFKRDKSDGRVTVPVIPFERPDFASAMEAAEKLKAEFTDEVFEVYGCVGVR